MTKIEILKQFYAALNANQIPDVLKLLAPDIVRVEWEGTPSEGSFRGLAEVKAHFIKGRDTWGEGSCEPEEFVTHGDKVVAHVHVHVRLKDRTDWLDGRVSDGFTFRDGKIIEFRSFFNKEEALAWAGA